MDVLAGKVGRIEEKPNFAPPKDSPGYENVSDIEPSPAQRYVNGGIFLKTLLYIYINNKYISYKRFVSLPITMCQTLTFVINIHCLAMDKETEILRLASIKNVQIQLLLKPAEQDGN
jgi:hypothetical protein